MRSLLTATRRCYSTQRLLVTGAGPERQGILREMTRIVWEDNGNVLDSQMSRLAGELTVMMLVEIPEEKVVDVQFKLSQQILGLNVCSKQVQDSFPSQSNTSLTVTGADSAETLQQVAKFLQQQDISLSDVVTQTNTAPMGGTLLFSLRGLAQIPTEIDRADLQRDLQRLSEALEIDVSLTDASE